MLEKADKAEPPINFLAFPFPFPTVVGAVGEGNSEEAYGLVLSGIFSIPFRFLLLQPFPFHHPPNS